MLEASAKAEVRFVRIYSLVASVMFGSVQVMKDFIDVVQIRWLPRRMDGNRRLNDAYGEHTRSF